MTTIKEQEMLKIRRILKQSKIPQSKPLAVRRFEALPKYMQASIYKVAGMPYQKRQPLERMSRREIDSIYMAAERIKKLADSALDIATGLKL